MQSRKHALSIIVKKILSINKIFIRKNAHMKDDVGKIDSSKPGKDFNCPICKQSRNTHPCGSPCYPIYHCYPPNKPDVRWTNYPLPPPPLPPFSSPPPPNLPTHGELCKASSNLRVHTEICKPIVATQQPDTKTPCGDNNTSTNNKAPKPKDCYHSDVEYRTINSASNHPVCERHLDVRPSVCDPPDVSCHPSMAREPSKINYPLKNDCGVTKTNRTPSSKSIRPFTIPGLPKSYVHPKPKNYSVPPPFISPDGAAVLKFLRLKSENDLDAYIKKICQLTTSKAHSPSSGDRGRPISRKSEYQITPPEQICSSKPTVEFVRKNDKLQPQIDQCESSETPIKMSSPDDICRHITKITTPSQEDLVKLMAERKTTSRSIFKPQHHTGPHHKDRIHSKQTIEERLKKNTPRSTGGDTSKRGKQPWISLYYKPKYQTNPSIDNICCNIKNTEVFISHSPPKPKHSKSPFIPEQSKSKDISTDCIKMQSPSKPVSEFSSQSPCLIKMKPACPDPPKRCPPKKFSSPRYSPPPISKEDICQSISRSQSDYQLHNNVSKCKPDSTPPPQINYSSPVMNYGKINIPNKPFKLCKPFTKEMWRSPVHSDPQTVLNMKKQIDEAKQMKRRRPQDPCCPEERGHNQIPYNPCCPTYHNGNSRKFKLIFFLLGFPLILFQMFRIYACGGFNEHHKKMPCCQYEYMRRRTKRFPWGNGDESLFHNPVVNHLPKDCDYSCKKQTEDISKKTD